MNNASAEYKAFIQTNRLKQNRIINRIIFASALTGPALALGVLFGAYHSISYASCAIITAAVLAIGFIQLFLIKRVKGGYEASFMGIVGLLLVLSMMAHMHVGIYISWFFVPLLSLLYCERKLYLFAGIAGYVAMMLTNLLIAGRMSAEFIDMTPMQWFVGYCSGFTIEYAVMFLSGLTVNKATCTHLQHFYNSRLEADSAIANTDELKQIALTDSLTGIMNRRAFDDEILSLKASGLPYAFTVLILDVNGLKRVNDALGHDAGDSLIKGAASCLTDVYGYCGKCYRTGGDEFTVLFSADAVTSRMLAEDLSDRIDRWADETRDLKLSVSFGWACSTEFPDADTRELIHTADSRMYVKKSKYHSENA